MLKPILLATAMMTSATAFAQDATSPTQTSPVQETTSPQTAEPVTSEPSTTTQSTTPADPTTAQTPPADTADQPAQGAAATSATQIAQVVEAEFPTYDQDSDGEITKAEFGKWMIALRSASDPNTKAESAEVQTWVGQAFASADKDKSAKVSKGELTTFLSQGAS